MKALAWASVLITVIIVMGLSSTAFTPAPVAQTTIVATVTSTPEGPKIIVPELVNVRMGPGTEYDKIGVLIAGQEAPAVGRSAGGEWIMITYPNPLGEFAWVYARYVLLEPNQLLPIIEPPPTPTPRVTATIDPTLAAQFNFGEAPPTPLPTYTPAEPVIQPTFEPTEVTQRPGLPPILAILGLLVVGMFGMVISVLRGR
ncbi:MAG: SH3 domain-containing protein [Anaerolineales bacterium]|nr:SH3 domain-containing protein [Anaerolineales bacterium]